jgi:hypothetical protein
LYSCVLAAVLLQPAHACSQPLGRLHMSDVQCSQELCLLSLDMQHV